MKTKYTCNRTSKTLRGNEASSLFGNFTHRSKSRSKKIINEKKARYEAFSSLVKSAVNPPKTPKTENIR